VVRIEEVSLSLLIHPRMDNQHSKGEEEVVGMLIDSTRKLADCWLGGQEDVSWNFLEEEIRGTYYDVSTDAKTTTSQMEVQCVPSVGKERTLLSACVEDWQKFSCREDIQRKRLSTDDVSN
jgi:hypothetical protein